MKKPLIFNGIAIYRHAIDCALEIIESAEIIAALSGDNGWQRSTVVHENGKEVEDNVRTNYSMSLASDSTISNPNNGYTLARLNRLIGESFSPCVIDYAAHFRIDVNPATSPNYSMLRYSSGQQYVSHMDHGKNTPRRLSGVGYLNGDFEGGGLHFEFLNFTYVPMAGDIVLFPSGTPYYHAALPVTSGIKYSVVNWWV